MSVFQRGVFAIMTCAHQRKRIQVMNIRESGFGLLAVKNDE